jgi:hypothetical protein
VTILLNTHMFIHVCSTLVASGLEAKETHGLASPELTGHISYMFLFGGHFCMYKKMRKKLRELGPVFLYIASNDVQKEKHGLKYETLFSFGHKMNKSMLLWALIGLCGIPAFCKTKAALVLASLFCDIKLLKLPYKTG